MSQSHLFHDSTVLGGYRDQTEPNYQTVSVCVGRRQHVWWSTLVVIRQGAVVQADPDFSSLQTQVCDGSCRARRVDLLAALVEESQFDTYPRLNPQGLKERRRELRQAWEGELYRSGIRDHISFHGRSVSYTLNEDGDSDHEEYCCGQYHVRRTCGEFGMGSSYGIIGYCNRVSCELVPIRLPRWVATRLRH